MAMNYTGHPGITLRAGLDQSPTRSAGPVPDDPQGEPHTITRNVAFHGRLFEEGKIIALARALEERLAGASPPSADRGSGRRRSPRFARGG